MQLYDYEKKHLEMLRGFLPECTVLLKSDGTFPLSAPEKVALYGEGARHTVKGGTGSGEVNSRYFVNIEEGLKNAGFTVTTDKWLNAYDSILVEAKKNFIAEIKKRAKANHTLAVLEGMGAVMKAPEYTLPLDGEGDLAVYVLARISGEGNDRVFEKGDILLSDTETRDILELNKKYSKFLLVLNVGGPVDLSELTEVKNILVLSQLGVETGDALADLMLGKTYPSGKLTTTWAYKKDFPTIGEFGDRVETRYREGVYVGYRYFDSIGVKNDYPFGFGLSYTDFAIGCKDVDYKDGKVTVTANVTNKGSYAGKEAVQLYVSVPSGKLDEPYQTLASFAKTKELKPGEATDVTLSFDMADIAPYDSETSSYILEKGVYVLRLGNSSINTSVCAVLRLSDTVTTLKARPNCGKPDFEDWKPESPAPVTVPTDAKVIDIDPASIVTGTVEYDKPEEIDPYVDALTDEELAYINIGHFNPKAGGMSVIGEASSKVAGAAGETSDILESKGFPVMVMADGPAGLRLSKKYAKANGRAYTVEGAMPAGMEDFLPGIALWFMKLTAKKPPKDAVYGDQYCTAIPIGTALAQSFNYDLALACGDIVGSEMERFNIHLWLAPALNIHRSIRCGRNFEYYSEDPLVSGMFAAALTNGVQAHKGCGTTIKHYAANNQETARYTNNSQVSERAMREIYLKGFGICIKKSQPHAVMTSYNLLNGVHTSERRDLTQDMLRSEYEYKGIVMTDWVIAMMGDKNSPYEVAKSNKVAAAGGDLFMPGCKADYDNVLAALKDGSLGRDQVKKNATRVYRMAKKLCE